MERKTYTREELDAKFDALPEHVRNYIFSADMEAGLQRVGQKHKLHIDQLGFLETDMVNVMLGTIEPSEFAPYIAQSLDLDMAEANAIAADVNAEVFEKIRAHMKEGGAAQTTTNTPPVPTVSTPSAPTLSSAPTSTTPPEPAPQALPAVAPQAAQPTFGAANAMLVQKTVTEVAPLPHQVVEAPVTPPTMPPSPTPKAYTTDPYREPVEPEK